jgi:hypothetical protein
VPNAPNGVPNSPPHTPPALRGADAPSWEGSRARVAAHKNYVPKEKAPTGRSGLSMLSSATGSEECGGSPLSKFGMGPIGSLKKKKPRPWSAGASLKGSVY